MTAKTTTPQRAPACTHPPARLFSWVAGDGVLVVCCCQCGQVLRGAA